jgi:predicted Zn-dependent peptidase
MWSPAFRPDEVEAERQVIHEEILMRADEPADLVHEVFTEAMYPEHPLGREVLGDEDSIEAMSPEHIRAFWAHHYRPGNIVFAAAGQLEHDQITDGVARRFAGASGGSAPEREAPTAAPVALTVDDRQTEQAHVVVGCAALHRDDERRYALSVLNHALGGGLSSRLFQQVREERGLAYSVYSYRSSYADAGNLSVYAGTAPDRVDEVLALVQSILDRMRDDGITDRELEVARGHLKGEMALSLEDSAARMSRIGRSELVHGEVLPIDEIVRRIDAVTLADVAEVGAEVLANERVLAVVGPFPDGTRFTTTP